MLMDIDSKRTSLSTSLLGKMEGENTDSSKKKGNSNELATVYAHNAPRILLETLSARTAQIILVATYIIFFLGFVYDLRDTLRSFEDGNRELRAKSCDSSNITLDHIWRRPGDWGCTFFSETADPLWVGHIDDLTNVISIELQVKQLNISRVIINGTETIITPEILQEVYVKYNLDLFGCYNTHNCQWQNVLTLRDQLIPLVEIYRELENSLTMNAFSNTFQNQEALPNKGKVKSYLAIVRYDGLNHGVFDDGQLVHYTFLTISRPPTVVGNIVLIAVLSITTITAIIYCRAVYSVNPVIRKWLPEQKWLVWYFIALILYQNPVYCVICWRNEPTSLLVFVSYVLDAFGQAAFFVIWLLFSDGLRRKSNYFLFYIPKFTIGSLIFLANLVILILQFPSVTPIDNRSPLLAVNNWSDTLKLVFICTSIAFLLLLVVWITWWIYSLWSTGRSLQRLPYMSSRYLQLSFRFFTLQATLVALFYVFQYMFVIYLILRNSPLSQNLTSLTDNINTLFRLQTQLIGKQIFLTVYALILAFLFLPAGLMDIHAVALTASFVINEDEIRDVVKSRRKAIKSMQALSQLAHAKCEVFCVDLALNLLDVAWEAYHDPKGLETHSSYGPMDLEKYGYTMVDFSYNQEHDTFCVIARHCEQNRIVVAFRGTSSKRHWNDNLNYTQKHIDVSTMALSYLDATDGFGLVDPTPLPSLLASLTSDGWQYDPDMDDNSEDGDDAHSPANLGEAILEGAQQVGDNIKKMASTVVGVTIGATTDLLVSAVARTPGLKMAVQTRVHSGFWDAYSVVREFVHTTVRREMSMNPGQLFFTGHSLGGALANLAAVDVSLHSLPRINAYLAREAEAQNLSQHQEQLQLPLHPGSHEFFDDNFENGKRDDPTATRRPRTNTLVNTTSIALQLQFNNRRRRTSTIRRRRNGPKIKACLYNFGSPRVGNWIFAQLTERAVPTSFRVVVDGDLVSAVPHSYQGYKHGGTEVIIDAMGAGSIIVDPSFVERQLRTQTKASVRVHSLLVYRKGLVGVKEAGEFMRSYVKDLSEDEVVDTVRLALFAGPLIPEAISSRFRKTNSSNFNSSMANISPMKVPTDSSHGDHDLSTTAIDISNDDVKENINNSGKNSGDRKEGKIDDDLKDQKPILHHSDDARIAEDIASRWSMQQSLTVVPFRGNR